LNITPYVTYILLIIEAVLILLYIYYPKILNALFVNRTKYIFQNEPYYLDNGKEKTIASIGDIHFQSEDLINGKNPNGEIPYSKNYGISFWVQINPRTISSNNEIQIFKFGSGSSCKPMLTYSSKSTNEKDIYKIYLSSTQKSDIDIHLPNQIWNHFFFQYNSTNVDLYINGVFERHVDFKVQNINIPVYQPTDIITVGNSGSYKINGAICNVVYFANTLSDFEIKNLYNLSTLLPYPQIL
jgi:hypothetical protein